MPGLEDLNSLLRMLPQGGQASAAMPAAMPMPAAQIANIEPDLPMSPTPMQQTQPSGPMPSRGGLPWGEIMKTISPLIGAATMHDNQPGQTGFMQGFQHGSGMAAQEHEKRQQGEQAKREQASQFRMEVFKAAREIDDPQEWAQFVDLATDSALQMGLINDPAEIKSFLEYPSHLEDKHKRDAALKRLESLMKDGYDLDDLAQQNASVQIASGPRGSMQTVKVRDLITIAGSMPEVNGGFVSPPKAEKTTAPSDYEQSFSRYLKGIGKTPETATSADEFAFKKAFNQADDKPVDPELAEMTKTLKQLQIDAAKQRGQGGIAPGQEFSMSERLAKAWNSANGSAREMQRQHAIMRTGLQRFRSGDKNGGSQAVLVTFQKILDPTSVVRESEYARTAAGQSMINRFEGYVDKLQKGGAGMTDSELGAMVETARQFIADMQTHSKGQRARIEAQAKKYKLDPATIFDDVLLGQPDASAPATNEPARIYYDANGNPKK